MLYQQSIYLAHLTLSSNGVTNKAATDIMSWLNRIATIVGLGNSRNRRSRTPTAPCAG